MSAEVLQEEEVKLTFTYFYFSSPTFSYLTIMASSKLVRNSDSELHMCTLLLHAVHL